MLRRRLWFGGDDVAGVAIEDVEHFNVSAVSKDPVGGVGLQSFVGEAGFEADTGGVGASGLGLEGVEAALVVGSERSRDIDFGDVMVSGDLQEQLGR
jgi:hypothetical protein